MLKNRKAASPYRCLFRRLIICCLMPGMWVFMPTILIAQEQNNDQVKLPPQVSDRELHKPTRMPDRIILSWTGDTATTQTVTWRTSTEVGSAFAEIALSEPGSQFRKKTRRRPAQTSFFKSDLSECHIHTVQFQELKPATKYVYRVGDGINWSEWFQFRTASQSNEPFSFIYFGDTQNRNRSLGSRCIRQAFIQAPGAAFTLYVGDLINAPLRDAEWGEWFSMGGWLNAMIPVIATPGNHEYYPVKKEDGTYDMLFTPHWRAQFSFPENGPEGLEEKVYYIDYQGARIISLDHMEQREKQMEWLENILSDNDNIWTIAAFHFPIYSMTKKRDSSELRRAWKPIFDKYGVDLVFSGHDHAYGRTGLIKGSKTSGTVYVVSVSGPKMYTLNPQHKAKMSRVAENTQLFQVISIEGKTLKFESRTAAGTLYDAFMLNKKAGNVNELVELIPDTPERRRRPSVPASTAN